MAMKWKKDRVIGRGWQGKVYLATEANPGLLPSSSSVAVKSVDLEFSATLKQEGKILNQLRRCPYIIQCFGEDVSIENGRKMYNLLLEHAPGGNLEDLLDTYYRRKRPESEVALYSCMLLQGLSHVHRHGYLHYDIKANNILVFPAEDGSKHLKIADFGLAREIPCHPFGSEQEKDVWALGLLVLEMISGFGEKSEPLKKCKFLRQITGKDTRKKRNQLCGNVSETGKDFLRGFFELSSSSSIRTTEKLLHHPFILNNIRTFPNTSNMQFQRNPFGFDDWVSTENLF